MKIKTITCCLLVYVLFAVFAHAVVVRQGTLQLVLTDIRMVTIDQQRYRVPIDVKVYKQSAPEISIPLSSELEGLRVYFDSRHVEHRGLELIYLEIADH